MKKQVLSILLILTVVSGSFIFASESQFEKGDTFFTVKAGVEFPSFEYFPNKEENYKSGQDATNLSLGGYASLSYQKFINNTSALGGELGYAFNYSSGKIMSLIPISARFTYAAVQTEKFDICLNADAGLCVLKFDSRRQISGFAKITLQPMYFFTEHWAIGVETGLMAAAELYISSNSLSSDNCITGYIPLCLSFTYKK